MKVEITAKNYEVRDALKEVLEKKAGKLSKYFEDDAKCLLHLRMDKLGAKMELTVKYKGQIIRGEGTGENFYDIIDLILPKVERQIYKHKTILGKRIKKDAFKEKQLFSGALYEDKKSNLVKTKRFKLTEMFIDDAIEQMELLGHTFFLYIDKITKRYNVIYKRLDGDIGLLDPIDG